MVHGFDGVCRSSSIQVLLASLKGLDLLGVAVVGVAAAVGRLDQESRRRVPGAACVRHRDEGRAFLARDDRRQAVRLLAHHQRALVIRRLDRLERATLS